MKNLHVKKGDRVKVVAGKDKGLIGEIIAVYPGDDRVTVQGVNVTKRHRRETSTPGGARIPAGIVSAESPIHVSNVQLVVKVDGEEVVTRVGYERREVTKTRTDGSEYPAYRSVRIAKKTGEEI